MDDGPSPLDPEEIPAVRAQARQVRLRAYLVGLVAAVAAWFLP